MKKNQLILLSLLGAMATPLAIQPAQATSAVEMRMKALEEQKKAEELAAQKAASEAQAAKQKEVAVQNEDVKKELNALISDINSNLGGGLTVVATADKDGLKAGVQEIDKALKTAVAEKKALEADLAGLKKDVEDLVKSINQKSTKNIAMPGDEKPKTLSATLKLADADVKGLVLGGPAVNLAPLKADIDTLIASLTAKTGALLAASLDDTPAEMINAVKAADAEVKKLVSPAEMTAIKNDVGALIGSLNVHSGKGLAVPGDNKPATITASLKLADTDLKALVLGGGGLPAGFAADVGHVNAELAKVLGAKYNAATMDFKTNGTGFKNSVDEFVKVIGTLPANFQTIVKNNGGPATILGFYGTLEDAIGTIANGTGAPGAKLGGSAATPASGLGKLKIAMDLHKVKL